MHLQSSRCADSLSRRRAARVLRVAPSEQVKEIKLCNVRQNTLYGSISFPSFCSAADFSVRLFAELYSKSIFNAQARAIGAV